MKKFTFFNKLFFTLLTLLIFGAGSAWADEQTFYAKVTVKSEPTIGGYVYIAQSAQTSTTAAADNGKTTDSSSPSYNNKWVTVFGQNIGKDSNHSFDLYGYQDAKEGFSFKGWAASATANSGTTNTKNYLVIYPYYPFSITATSTSSSNPTSATYHAIFAGIVNNTDNKPTASLDFGTINLGTSKELTITFKHAHAGKITSSFSGTNSGDFALKAGTSLPTNSVALDTKTITVVFTPSCSASRSATLTLTGSNGGSMTISLSGTATPYASTISTTNGSVDVSVGSTATTTNLNNRVTTNADGTRTYTCNNSAVTISGSNFSATKQGTYTVNVSIAQGCQYAVCSSSFTITVNRRNQSLTMANGSVNATTNKTSPTKLNLSTLCTQVGNGAVTYELVSAPNAMNGSSAADSCVIDNTNKTFHAWVSGTYTLRAKAAITDQYNAVTSANFTVTVNKVANTLALYKTTDALYVDEVKTNVVSKNSNATVNTTTSDNTLAYYNAAQNKLFVINSNNQSFTSKVVTLTVSQDATDVYAASGVKTLTLTVKKYTNTITCDWSSWTKNMTTDDAAYVNFSSNNTEAGAPAITVDQETGDLNATYYPDQHAIYTSYNLGSATWTVAQAENYKYIGDTKTLTVNIVTKAEGCPVVGPLIPDNTASSVGEIILPKAGSGKVLSFQMKKNGSLGNQATVTAYDANNTQLEQWKPEAASSWYYDDAADHTFTLPDNTKKVVFDRGGTLGDSDDPYINNIRITRKEWMKIQDVEGNTITSLTMPVNTVGGNHKEATFYIDYSDCADHISVASNNEHVTVSENSFATTADRKAITVSYASDLPEVIDAVITVYTTSQNATINIHAETERMTPTLEWASLYQTEPVTLPVTFTDNAAATASNEAQVTYSVRAGEESVISITDGGRSFTVIGEGTAHLTATSAESPMYLSVSETKEINATNKKIQRIVWNQNFTRSIAVGDVKELTAQVRVLDLATGLEEVDDDRTALIQYEYVEDNGVIEKVDATHFRVIGADQTTITASVAGDEDYEAATSVTKLVRVRENQTGECDPALMTETTDEIEFFAYDLTFSFPEISHVVTLDRTLGTPDKLSFYVRGVSYNMAIEYYNGGIDVYQSTDGGNTWGAKLTTVTPDKNTTVYSEPVQLSPNATHLRFVRPQGGRGYHYVGNVNVTMLPDLQVENTTVNLGNIGAGSIYNGVIPVHYYNVKGDLTVEKANNTNGLTISQDVIDADCGSYGIYNLPFSVSSTEEGDWTNQVTITDPISHLSVAVTLNATITVAEQTIHWSPATTVTSTTPPVLNAYASSGLPVTYEVTSGSNVAAIVNGQVVIKDAGQFTIKVSQAGNVSYKPAYLSVTFTVQGGYIFNGAVNTDWNNPSNWEIGLVPTINDDVIISGNVIISTNATANSLTIEEGSNVTLTVSGALTVGDGNSFVRDAYGDLHVMNEGKVVLGNGTLQVRDFILDAKLGDSDTKKAASGQVVAPEMLSINHKAYFQMTFDPEGAISYGWYDFTVPFEVNINGGISRINSAADKVMVCGTDFIIMEADEQNRANGGKGWRQLHGGVMNPGKLYTIGFDDGVNQNTFLFAWNGNGNMAKSNSYAVRYATGGDGSKNGWNGLGNGMMCHGYPDCSYKKQAYNHKDNVYNLVDGNVTFAVGSAFFIQVPAAGSIVWAEDMADARPVFAPKYEVEQVEECRLTLRDENDKQVDVLYYSASEEATDAYVIGKDLLKLGTPTEAKVAQMWATKGGKKLCDIEAALVNDNAVAPLSLFTPKAGEYMLSVEQMPEDATLYLTYNDQVIWDLTQGAYMFVLEKGSTEGYGLSLQAKRAPQVTTGMENTNADSHSVRKVLINNTIYIITPEGEMYNIMGKNIQ